MLEFFHLDMFDVCVLDIIFPRDVSNFFTCKRGT